VPLILVPILVLLAVIVLIPVSLVQRYRMGTSRRPARRWVATLNVIALAFSTGMLLTTAAVMMVWVPDAVAYTLAGLAIGVVLGVVGLWASRWEASPSTLHYTPNRWLVLAITAVVSLRLLYGFWRSWHAWRFTPEDTSWLAEAGAAGSLGAGAVVLGYYLTYWWGIRRRIKRHRHPSARGNRA
jgi:membrane protein CcdC involved in cytochrome C biogenesis